jgi:hypothetical protein
VLTLGRSLPDAVTSSSTLGRVLTLGRSFSDSVTLSGATLYGSGYGADDLNNSQVGDTPNWKVSYRFRATQSSALTSITVYIIGATHPGYGAGTGGTLRAGVFADDGTASHFPTGSALATVDLSMAGVDSAGVVFTWGTPATLVAGTLYHIVFENVDGSPTTNFVSVDGTFLFEDDLPWEPRFANTDWANLTKSAIGSWQENAAPNRSGTISPMADLAYANGLHQGQGYIETWGRGGGSGYDAVDGTIKLRETFTVSGGDRLVRGGAIRLARTSGTADLTVRLEDSGGTLIEAVALPAVTIPTSAKGGAGGHGEGQTWHAFAFTAIRTLSNGSTYHLVLSTSAGTEYWMTIIRTGASYGYTAATYFDDGHAQIATDGSTWTDVLNQSGNPSTEGDLQFWLGTPDTLARTGTFLRAVSDAVTTSSILARALTLGRSFADSLTTSDALAFVKIKVFTIADAVTTSDAVVRVLTLGRSLTDSVTSSDAAVRVLTLGRSFADTVTLSSTLGRALTLGRSLADSVTTSDVLTRSLTAVRAFPDTLTTSDAWTRLLTLGRTFADSVTTSSALDVSKLGAKVLAFADAVTTSDAVVRLLTLGRSLADTVTTSDALTRTGTFLRAFADSVTTSSTLTRIGTFARTFPDSVTTSDAWTRTGTFVRALADTVTSSSTLDLSKFGAILIAFADAVTTSDVWTRALALGRSLADAVTTSSTLVLARTLFRSFSDAVTTSSTLTRVTTAVRGFADTITTSDAFNRTMTAVRAFADALSLSTALDAVKVIIQTIGGFPPLGYAISLISRALGREPSIGSGGEVARPAGQEPGIRGSGNDPHIGGS